MNQNINHVDHVLWVSHLKNQEANVARLSELTNQQFDGPVSRPDVGLRVYLSWEGGLEIVAPLVGRYATSMEMAGITLTLCRLDSETERLLRAPCDCPYWKN